jgi:uncharacterized repeat protein (TIGR01451 family)
MLLRWAGASLVAVLVLCELAGARPAAAATSHAIDVTLGASIDSVDFQSRAVFPQQVLEYDLTVSNSSGSPQQNVMITDPVPTIDSVLKTGSVTCGSVPDCTSSVTNSQRVIFKLSTVAPSARDLKLSFQVTILPKRDIFNRASWTGGGCGASRCQTNSLTNKIIPSPIAISASPINRAFVPASQRITFTLTIYPYAYIAGMSNVVITTRPITVDARTSPTGTTYVPGSASCGSVPQCTVSVSGQTIAFTLTPASFAGGGKLRVTFAFVNNATTGTLSETLGWTGGACPIPACPPRYPVAFSAIPGPQTSPSSSPTTQPTSAGTTPPPTRSSGSGLAFTGTGIGTRVLAYAGALLLLLWLVWLAVVVGQRARRSTAAERPGTRPGQPAGR